MGKWGVPGLLACVAVVGCQQAPHPLFDAGSESGQMAAWLGTDDREVVELCYCGPRPAKELRAKLGLPPARYEDEFQAQISEPGGGGQITLCFPVTPESVAQWTVVHERLAERGYRIHGTPVTWSYRAPKGLREGAEQLIPAVRDALRRRLQQRFPDAAVVIDRGPRSRLPRKVWITLLPIDSRKRWDTFSNPNLHHRFFPTLALVVSHLPVGLTDDERAQLDAMITETLTPLIRIDARYHRVDRFRTAKSAKRP